MDRTAKQITIVVHTMNRPEFLHRLLRYFSTVSEFSRTKIVIADASDATRWAIFESAMQTAPIAIRFSVERASSAIPLYERIAKVLSSVTTPYVLLAADDDFYFPGWLEKAVSILDTDPTVAVIYGQFMTFRIGGFATLGSDVTFDITAQENPPLPWLEDEGPSDRLAELARQRRGLASPGWYALQRVDLLRGILTHASEHGLGNLPFEKFLIIAQAASGKLKMLDDLFIARQLDDKPVWKPYGYSNNRAEIAKLLDCCTSYFECRIGFSNQAAHELTRRVLAAEISLMKEADSKRHLRAIANRLPFLRQLWRRASPVPTADVLRDPRLPTTPRIEDYKAEVATVAHAVQPLPNTGSRQG